MRDLDLERVDQQALEKIERLVLEGINSGEPIEVDPGYWEDKRRQLDEQVKKSIR